MNGQKQKLNIYGRQVLKSFRPELKLRAGLLRNQWEKKNPSL